MMGVGMMAGDALIFLGWWVEGRDGEGGVGSERVDGCVVCWVSEGLLDGNGMAWIRLC